MLEIASVNECVLRMTKNEVNASLRAMRCDAIGERKTNKLMMTMHKNKET